MLRALVLLALAVNRRRSVDLRSKSRQHTARMSLSVTYGGLVPILLGFALQAIGYFW